MSSTGYCLHCRDTLSCVDDDCMCGNSDCLTCNERLAEKLSEDAWLRGQLHSAQEALDECKDTLEMERKEAGEVNACLRRERDEAILRCGLAEEAALEIQTEHEAGFDASAQLEAARNQIADLKRSHLHETSTLGQMLEQALDRIAELVADLRIEREVSMHGCECSRDEACEWARKAETAEARVKVLDMLAGISDVHVSALSRERDEAVALIEDKHAISLRLQDRAEKAEADRDNLAEELNATRARVVEARKDKGSEMGKAKRARTQDLQSAIDGLANLLPNGQLLAAFSPSDFIREATDEIVNLRDEVARLRKKYETCQTCGCDLGPWEPENGCETCLPPDQDTALHARENDERNRANFGVGLKKVPGE